VFPALDRGWKTIVPPFAEVIEMARSGLPFHIASGGRTQASPRKGRIRSALVNGETIYLPQSHEVLPRLARLVVAIRSGLLGPFRHACSFLFAVEGRGKKGMGLHHDGDVDSFWIQIEGRRIVTVGPVAPADLPLDLEDGAHDESDERLFRTFVLEPGSLFYLPPRVLHRVVYRERSVALSLTFDGHDPREELHALVDRTPPQALSARGSLPPSGYPRLLLANATFLVESARNEATAAGVEAAGLLEWEIAEGTATEIPQPGKTWLHAQVPAHPGPIEGAEFRLWLPEGSILLPDTIRPFCQGLELMPSVRASSVRALGTAGAPLLEYGILADVDLPLRIVPDKPRRLDGWSFA
jgi:mannose-6-phosphate isomerase-like protein (cupin superfamily)